MTNPALVIRVNLDVENLDKSCAFYQLTLGFAVHATERAGMLQEVRYLRAPLYPGVELRLRAAFGKRVFGSQPGGMTALSFPVDSIPDAIRRVSGQVRWLGTSPEADAEMPRPSIRFLDPDAYVIELLARS